MCWYLICCHQISILVSTQQKMHLHKKSTLWLVNMLLTSFFPTFHFFKTLCLAKSFRTLYGFKRVCDFIKSIYFWNMTEGFQLLEISVSMFASKAEWLLKKSTLGLARSKWCEQCMLWANYHWQKSYFFRNKMALNYREFETFFEVFYFEISFISTEENVTTLLLAIFNFSVP